MIRMDHGSGHCLCGAVSYEFTGPPNWQAHCHCESCRRNCSAAFASYFAINHGKWKWTGTRPAAYASSPGVRRHFCASCGTPMAFEGEKWAHELHFYAASLSDPSAFVPTLHVNWNEHLPWVKLADGLRTARTPRRMAADADADFAPVLSLIRSSFAFMADRIDPPSSANRLTLHDIAQQAATAEVWVLEDLGNPIACVFLTPQDGQLYLGKLAVAESFRKQGLARQLVKHATARARSLGLTAVVLETRVELTENHAAFRAMGFMPDGERAHPGYDRPTTLRFILKLP